nr:MAG TPA: hypothetical protein [Caudoviricetes sp.]
MFNGGRPLFILSCISSAPLFHLYSHIKPLYVSWQSLHLGGFGSALCSHSISFHREPAISKVWSIRPRSFQLPLRLKQIIGNLLPEFNS